MKCYECDNLASGSGAFPELCTIHGTALENEILEAEILYSKAPCMECGAMTQEEAQEKCHCGGDKDSCHGTYLWPD